MSDPPSPKDKRLGFRPALVLGLLLAGFIVLQCLLPLGTAVRIGVDEDFELSKATLCLHGYKLYTEIWSDQPPLYVSLLTGILKQASPAILGPRLLTTAFTLLLLSSVFILVRWVNGLLAAGLATGLLIASPGFLELSSSAMQEIPALAPAVAALCLLLPTSPRNGLRPWPAELPHLHEPPLARRLPWILPLPFRRGEGRGEGSRSAPCPIVSSGIRPPGQWRAEVVAAGALFGMALQMKLIGAVYLPLAALILWLRRPPPARLKPVAGDLAVLAAALSASFVALNCLTGSPLLLQFQQGWSAHFAPPNPSNTVPPRSMPSTGPSSPRIGTPHSRPSWVFLCCSANFAKGRHCPSCRSPGSP